MTMPDVRDQSEYTLPERPEYEAAPPAAFMVMPATVVGVLNRIETLLTRLLAPQTETPREQVLVITAANPIITTHIRMRIKEVWVSAAAAVTEVDLKIGTELVVSFWGTTPAVPLPRYLDRGIDVSVVATGGTSWSLVIVGYPD